MKRTIALLAASALIALPTSALSAPGGSQGSTNGAGWDHLKGPATTGQPGAECGDEGALNRPGNAQYAPGSAFNPDGHAGTVYAGEQPQNQRNSASVSQYDAACLDHPR